MTEHKSDDEISEYLDTWTSQKSQQKHFDDGYREGVTLGKEETLQDSFDEGYVQGFEKTFRLASLRGMLSALALKNADTPVATKLLSFIEIVKKRESEITLNNA